MIVKGMVFVGSLAALPIATSLSPESIAGKLGVASAQLILSTIAVVEAFVIYKGFCGWRKDVEAERASVKDQADKFEGLMVAHTEAMTKQATSNEQIATAVHRNSDVIEKCGKK